jgi:DNA topoisomerase-1
VPGFAWESVQHDPTVAWLANWKENILNSAKYMQLAASSSFKGKSDMGKYDKAMKLKGFIGKIRADYTERLVSSDPNEKQLATCMWIIDKLALRVGGEKGEDEADTVGCCSLRLEHLTFPDGDTGAHEIELEFLGKDSMLFKQTIDFDQYDQVGVQVFKNLRSFCKRKNRSEDVFDLINPSILNSHLQTLMPGLSAKVFRTYNASETLQEKLPSEKDVKNLSVQDKVVLYNNANRDVAILCNHQRTVSSAILKGIANLEERLELFKSQRHAMKEWKKLISKGKDDKIPLKKDDDRTDEALAALEAAKKLKNSAKTEAQKIAATKAQEKAISLKREAAKAKSETSHLFARAPSEDQVDKRIASWTEKIKKLEISVRDRQDNKEVSLGTSKINYMDPRISVAWCKRNEVPIDKIFAKTLRDKFVWAM